MKVWPLLITLALLLSGCEFVNMVNEEPAALKTPEPKLEVDFKPAGSLTLILDGESTKLPIPALLPQDVGSKPYVHAHCVDKSGAEHLSLKFYLPDRALRDGQMSNFEARDPQQLSTGFIVVDGTRVEIKGGTWTTSSSAGRFQAIFKVETDRGPANGRIGAYTFKGHPEKATFW